ncbi:hypothetical protein ACTMQT_12045 [Pseudomonas syringae pv. aptata]|uniref:hypothetical protein n=1 Tax=Pseudomonas syringae TaxID=317 RepID=UPI003F8CEBF0
MSQAKDTLLRLFALLRLIPAEPQRIANPTLFEKLAEKSFFVTLRLIQRYLSQLSIPFLMRCNDSEIPLRWSFTQDAPEAARHERLDSVGFAVVGKPPERSVTSDCSAPTETSISSSTKLFLAISDTTDWPIGRGVFAPYPAAIP